MLEDSTPYLTSDDVFLTAAGVPKLFRHTRREQWGLGIVVRRDEERVQMQFEDGHERTFKAQYFHLFEMIDRPADEANNIIEALRRMRGDTETQSTSASRRPGITLDEQVGYFRELFPGGFQDAAFESQHRGDEVPRPLKRHRAALVKASSNLTSEEGQAILAGDDATAVHTAATSLVTSTDLVRVAERKAFAALPEDHHAAFADALRNLLNGEDTPAARLDGFVSVLEKGMGETPSWELTTIFLGAVQPAEHVVVREAVMTRQASAMAPGLSVSKRPMGTLYQRLLNMTLAVRDLLGAAGMSPRDLLDVQEFMWISLKPNARKRILEQRSALSLGTVAPPA